MGGSHTIHLHRSALLTPGTRMCFFLEACIRSYVESLSTRALFCKLTTMYLYDFDRYNSQDIDSPFVISMTMIQSHSSIRKWSVNSEHLQAVSARLGVPSSWPEDPWAVGSLVGSSDGHSSGDPDGIWPVPCLLWLLPSRGNSMCRLVPVVQYRESHFAEVVSSIPKLGGIKW